MIPASTFQSVVRRAIKISKPSSASRYTLFLDRVHCIGCGDCPKVCQEHFKMIDDGKAAMKGAKIDEVQSKALPVKEFDCAKRAVLVCPVDVIWVKDHHLDRNLTKRVMANQSRASKRRARR